MSNDEPALGTEGLSEAARLLGAELAITDLTACLRAQAPGLLPQLIATAAADLETIKRVGTAEQIAAFARRHELLNDLGVETLEPAGRA